ncbi:MAG TPA: hypothetical protein VM101_08205 [Flavitalea sp.]|nr:hypothetical protein [Flavitalea sp.]
MNLRDLTNDEQRLIRHLISLANNKNLEHQLEKLKVKEMNDSGMGSLLLFPAGKVVPNRDYGQTVSEVEFHDADKAVVLASLNVDENGDLFELDIWKTNFDRLHKIPDEF